MRFNKQVYIQCKGFDLFFFPIIYSKVYFDILLILNENSHLWMQFFTKKWRSKSVLKVLFILPCLYVCAKLKKFKTRHLGHFRWLTEAKVSNSKPEYEIIPKVFNHPIISYLTLYFFISIKNDLMGAVFGASFRELCIQGLPVFEGGFHVVPKLLHGEGG